MMAVGLIAVSCLLGAVLPKWEPGEFQIHQLYTGAGESQLLIFPEGTTMLIDCGDFAAITRGELAVPVKPGPERLAGDWVARYVERVNPNKNEVDYLLISHWHADHTGTRGWQSAARRGRTRLKGCFRSGIALAAETLHFRKAIDRGWPTFDDPEPTAPSIDGWSLELVKRMYSALQERDGLAIEKIRLGAKDQVIPLRGEAKDFSVFNLCANGRIVMKDGTVATVTKSARDENLMSIGNVFTYGKFRYFTAGDFSDSTEAAGCVEETLAKAVGRVNVAKVNHHGHHGTPRALVEALAPQVWTAAVWDQLHMTADVLANMAADGGLIAPGIFPEPRATKERGESYFGCIAPEVVGRGCHVVITVKEGGERFRVDFVSAEDEKMEVVGTREFKTE